MYEPNVDHPIYTRLSLPVMTSLVTGSFTEETSARNELSKLRAFLLTLPGMDEGTQFGLRGTIWVSPNLGNVIRAAILSSMMVSPPTLPFTSFWSFITQPDWLGDKGGAGAVSLGQVNGYNLITGTALGVQPDVLIVAVPTTDFASVQGFLNQLAQLHPAIRAGLTPLNNLQDNGGQLTAYGVTKPLNLWGNSVLSSNGANLALYQDVDTYLKPLFRAKDAFTLTCSNTPLSPGDFMLAVRAQVTSGQLEVSLDNGSNKVLSIVMDAQDANLSHRTPSVVTQELGTLVDHIFVIQGTWTTNTLEITVFVPGSTPEVAYSTDYAFDGALETSESLVLNVVNTGVSDIRNILLWDFNLPVGVLINRLKRS